MPWSATLPRLRSRVRASVGDFVRFQLVGKARAADAVGVVIFLDALYLALHIGRIPVRLIEATRNRFLPDVHGLRNCRRALCTGLIRNARRRTGSDLAGPRTLRFDLECLEFPGGYFHIFPADDAVLELARLGFVAFVIRMIFGEFQVPGLADAHRKREWAVHDSFLAAHAPEGAPVRINENLPRRGR